MVTGFEELTYNLSAFEKTRILPIVLKGWRDKKDDQIIQMKDMIAGLNEYCITFRVTRPTSKCNKIYKVNGPRMRQIIHYLRVSGKLHNLIATSKGYFITNDKEKIKSFIKSCRERANSFNEVADAMEVYNFERKESNIHNLLPELEFNQQYKEIVSEHDFEDVDDFFNQCTTISGVKINSYTLNTQFKQHSKGLLTQVYINDLYCMIFHTGGYVFYKKKQISTVVHARCCGRCDGVHDICIADRVCGKHNETGCTTCWPRN